MKKRTGLLIALLALSVGAGLVLWTNGDEKSKAEASEIEDVQDVNGDSSGKEELLSEEISMEGLHELFFDKKYEDVIRLSEMKLKEAEVDDKIVVLLFRSYVETGKLKEAYELVEAKSEVKDLAKHVKSAGVLAYQEENFELAKAFLGKMKSINGAEDTLEFRKFGFTDIYKEFTFLETEHFRFYFQPESLVEDIESFAKTHEEAYVNIVSRLGNIELPKKVDSYIWDSEDDINTYVGRDRSFAEPENTLTHFVYTMEPGHEMCHIIYYHFRNSHEGTRPNRFIEEGLATYFDQVDNNKLEIVKSIMKDANIESVDVDKLWKSSQAFQLDYCIGATFLKYLEEQEGWEKLYAFLKDPTHRNFNAVYGEENLEKLKAGYEALVNE